MKISQIIVTALCALIVFGCSAATQQTMSPTDTLKTFIEASKKKDVETVRKTLSKGTLDIIEKSAKTQNTTVDELLKKDSGVAITEMPETRGEKIESDTATVEVKNVVTGEFDKVPFVKENGSWKIALDKVMQDLQKKATEQMTMPQPAAPDAGKSDGDAPPKTDK